MLTGLLTVHLPESFADQVIDWNTFSGSSGTDSGEAIAVDGSGNVYVAGYSNATWGSPVNSYTGDYDAFVAKFNSSGALQWNTFLGSSSPDYCNTIAVDASGNVYVGGYSNATWGSPVNPFAVGGGCS
ncbi:SBBP repeat-containing protein [Candidatus Latescibacterota bacterium]